MKYIIVIILFLIYLIGENWYKVEACSCAYSHPQEHFCKADFVILVRIKRERLVNMQRIYKVRVRKEYKLSEKSQVALKSGRLVASDNEAMCGVNLEPGGLYAVSGNIFSLKPYITLCGFIKKWQDLTKRQRKGLKMMYRHGCTCKIKNCFHGKCAKEKDTCNWTNLQCHYKEGICLRQASKNCMWTRNAALTNCLNNNSLTISRWSG